MSSWKPARRRLSGDTARQASSGEVKDLRREMHNLKEALADRCWRTVLLKKNMLVLIGCADSTPIGALTR